MLKYCLNFCCSSMVLLCFYCNGTSNPASCQSITSITIERPRFPIDNNISLADKLEAFIQPTASGTILSGTYGCVRNNGRRFHEGIDIKSFQRNRRNEPTDKILASLSGKVAYINDKPQDSTYGRYIVLEHKECGLTFYTLYAHLSEINHAIKINTSVRGGQILGIMGHSSSSGIPKSRAHLHFEVGMRLGDGTCFEAWYKTQKFSTSNKHGCWNGMNLVGLDPLNFLRSQTTFSTFLKQQPIAFQLSIKTQKIPQFITLNPALLKHPLPQKLSGWKISFNWVGCPILWEPLIEQPKKPLSVTYINRDELSKNGNRHTLELNKKGVPYIGKILERQLFELFGERFRL